MLLERLAELMQEALRVGLVGLQDERGMSRDALRALVAAHGLGRDISLALLLPGPAADAGHADPEARGGLMAGGAFCNGRDDALVVSPV